MKIQVLGSGCATCKNLHELVETVAKKVDPMLTVDYSTDMLDLAKLGAMGSPVFAIDGKIITAGKLPSEIEIKEAIEAKM